MLASTPAYTWHQAASETVKLDPCAQPYPDQAMTAPGVSILYPSPYIITTSSMTTANWVKFCVFHFIETASVSCNQLMR